MPNWAFLLVRLSVSSAGAALITWVGWKLGGFAWALTALVFSTPLIGFAIARPLVEFLHEGFTWLSLQPLERWHGNYYEFGGVQVRVYEDEGALWFDARDVVRAADIRMNADTVQEGRVLAGPNVRCLSSAEIETLLAAHRTHEAGRFLLWMRREVITPWERKRSGALVPR
jgi:hypothetical protein